MKITILVVDKKNLPCPVGVAYSVAEAEQQVAAMAAQGFRATYFVAQK
jgi:hypothetical protein